MLELILNAWSDEGYLIKVFSSSYVRRYFQNSWWHRKTVVRQSLERLVRGFEDIEVAEKNHIFRPGGFGLCLGSQEFRKIPNFLKAPRVIGLARAVVINEPCR